MGQTEAQKELYAGLNIATIYVWNNGGEDMPVNHNTLNFAMGIAGAGPVLDFLRLRKEFNSGYGRSLVYEGPGFTARHFPKSGVPEMNLDGVPLVLRSDTRRLFSPMDRANLDRANLDRANLGNYFPVTVLLEERVRALGLEIPDHEIAFEIKEPYDTLPVEMIKGVAAYLGDGGYKILLTAGTDIEGATPGGTILASPEIEEALRSPKPVS